MDGLSGVPTYTPETQKEKLSRGIIDTWPRVYRFVNGILFFILRTTKNTVIGAIEQIFHS